MLLNFGPFPHSFYYLPVVETVVEGTEMEKKRIVNLGWLVHLKSFRENWQSFHTEHGIINQISIQVYYPPGQ